MIKKKIKNKKTKKMLRIIALLMFVIAICFIYYALQHPEASWPIGNEIICYLYAIYVIIIVVFTIISFL